MVSMTDARIPTTSHSPDTIELFCDTMSPLTVYRDGNSMRIDPDRLWQMAECVQAYDKPFGDETLDALAYATKSRQAIAQLAKHAWKRSGRTTPKLTQADFERMADLFVKTRKSGLDDDTVWDKVAKSYLRYRTV